MSETRTEFPPNARYQVTDPGSSENTKQEECLRKTTAEHIFSNYWKAKVKKKILKETEEKHLT